MMYDCIKDVGVDLADQFYTNSFNGNGTQYKKKKERTSSIYRITQHGDERARNSTITLQVYLSLRTQYPYPSLYNYPPSLSL
jgi:hypothetical protein